MQNKLIGRMIPDDDSDGSGIGRHYSTGHRNMMLLQKTNQLMFKDLKKFQAELDKYNDVNYASKVEIDCAKAKGI
ncbi:hypothetical protein Tco_0333578 [Tanacetum coccineum]